MVGSPHPGAVEGPKGNSVCPSELNSELNQLITVKSKL